MRTLSIQRATRGLAAALIALCCVAIGSTYPAAANSKYAGIVIDAKTGRTLYSYKADSSRYPASLTKMMTMYMMFEALDEGRLKKNTRIVMSKYAASRPPSKLGIRAGRSIAAEHAILALATKSANDVATAVAEHFGGSEANFGAMMTRKARQLGMKRTTFKNASGLTAKGQKTTARDMAKLGLALREHFPQYYRYFSTRNFKYGKANYRNHNRLLGQIKGVDGIKTGYTRASGFNLVSSVETNRRSIVAVVLGGRSGKSRNAQMRKLINTYLRKASRGSKKLQIAARKPSGYTVASANIRLPKRGPVPVFREQLVAKRTLDVSKPIQLASVAVPVQSAAKFEQVTVADRLSQQGEASNAVPVSKQTLSNQLSYVDETVTAGVTNPLKPEGWVIQIAATDSKQTAVGMLKKAQARAPSILGAKSIYTEQVNKGGAVLHRARFAGFNGKADARKACSRLKKLKIACYALNT
ncbi:MAG: D-alanyl-D-alanine carboxypeptidase [Pseudomonadota bacterium]